MGKGRVGRVVISEFLGMDVGKAPVRLLPGACVLDQNGRTSAPYEGSWTPRKSYQRMCIAGSGAVMQEASTVEAVYQFTPTTSNLGIYSASSVNTKTETTTIVLVAGDGKLQSYKGVQPRV